MHSLNPALVTLAIISALFASAMPAPWNHDSPKTLPSDVSSAYSGAGGQAPGGSVISNNADNDNSLLGLFGSIWGGGGLANIASNNGGPGGVANSAAAYAHNRRHVHGHEQMHEVAQDNRLSSTDAYSGAGGMAPGGTVSAKPAMLNVLSNNGGAGGSASSGPGVAEHEKQRRLIDN